MFLETLMFHRPHKALTLFLGSFTYDSSYTGHIFKRPALDVRNQTNRFQRTAMSFRSRFERTDLPLSRPEEIGFLSSRLPGTCNGVLQE